MKVDAPKGFGEWVGGKIILAYALSGLMLIASAGLLKAFSGRGIEETVFALAPRIKGKAAAEVDRAKIRQALAKLPAVFVKLGIALPGVAAVARAVRSIEPTASGTGRISSSEAEGVDRPGSIRVSDWAVSFALAALVFAQVAPTMDRPLRGDELENYEQHLTLPLQGTLTTMGGANNQLGFSILAWASIRLFGDCPASVRLPALLGAMLLPVVAYRYGSKEFGRAGATVLGLLLATWPDIAIAGTQGRSYSLLMLVSVVHLFYFKRLATAPDRRSGLIFAATLASACTLHMWFVIVAGAELLFLGLLKVAARLRWGIFGIRTPLRVETFLSLLTLGGLCAAVVQAGILPKFVFILTQKNPVPVDAQAVLDSMVACLQGTSFETDAFYLGTRGLMVLRTAINIVALIGLLACIRGARKNPDARFLIVFFAVVASTFFLVVYAQNPVYLYARFFVVLPMILAWAGARGWGLLLDSKPNPRSVATTGLAGTTSA